MLVSVDDTRCQGHARCWALAPRVFALDGDLGHAVVLTSAIADDDEEAVRRAVASCPERALRLVET